MFPQTEQQNSLLSYLNYKRMSTVWLIKPSAQMFSHPVIVANSSPKSEHDILTADPKITQCSHLGIDPHRRLTFSFYRSLGLCRLRFLQSNRRLMLPIHSLVCLVTFGLSLPVAISLFPQMSQVQYSGSSAASVAIWRADGSASSWEKKKSNYLYIT